MNKKVILPILSITLIISAYFANTDFRNLVSKEISEEIFWISIPVFVFSLISFFLKGKVQVALFKFSLYAYGLGLLISLFSLSDTRDFAPSMQEIFLYGFTILYSLISLGIIIYKSVKKN